MSPNLPKLKLTVENGTTSEIDDSHPAEHLTVSTDDGARLKNDHRIESMEKRLVSLLETVPETGKKSVELQFAAFASLFKRFLNESGPSVDWNRIKPLPADSIIEYESLEEGSEDSISEMLNKLIVVKLNGGLGTSMGCRGPKSIIKVKNDFSFLDLTVLQIASINNKYNVSVPLVLMNSFNTHSDTENIIKKYRQINVEIYSFDQSCFPRISKESFEPIATSYDVENNKEGWYPPGHGDFYDSFKNSGLLQKFIDEGRVYGFVSNVDNLGATVDLNILNMLLNTKNATLEFVMELTNKTTADVKGGTLIRYGDKLRLLELAQVPEERVEEFKSINKFKLFNTNNLWVKLEAVDRCLDNGPMALETIVNNKSLDNGLKVVQLETAVGAAMKLFDCSIGINVPRSRFLPVKKTSDLLLVMSDVYDVQNGSLVMNENRTSFAAPLVKLDDAYFSKVEEFVSRFQTVPSLVKLDNLTVSGDVTFGSNVQLKGSVTIIANRNLPIEIPSGSVIDNQIVSGSLRLQNH